MSDTDNKYTGGTKDGIMTPAPGAVESGTKTQTYGPSEGVNSPSPSPSDSCIWGVGNKNKV